MNEPTPLTTASTIPAREPITCHVLDLTTGRPAPSIAVSLTLLRPFGPSAPLTAVTSSDGRVNQWNGEAGSSLSESSPPRGARWGADGLELEIQHGSVLWRQSNVFPRGRGQVLCECERRTLPCALALGPVELYDISGQLRGSDAPSYTPGVIHLVLV